MSVPDVRKSVRSAQCGNQVHAHTNSKLWTCVSGGECEAVKKMEEGKKMNQQSHDEATNDSKPTDNFPTKNIAEQ